MERGRMLRWQNDLVTAVMVTVVILIRHVLLTPLSLPVLYNHFNGCGFGESYYV